MITHADLIRQLKKQAKVVGNQKALAMRLGISEQYMSDILKSKRMPGEKVLSLEPESSSVWYSNHKVLRGRDLRNLPATEGGAISQV